jgi:hypothetical protein
VAFRALIDRMRGKPEWEHPDPAVRAEAVLKVPSSEAELLRKIAREDAEPRVRRAAVKKLADAEALAGLVRDDADAGVREEAAAHLVTLAVHAADEASAEAALALVAEPRHLAEVAKTAPREATRRRAVDRLADPRLLAAVVRECTDAGTRLSALARIDDPILLAGFAQKSDQKAVALAAVERIGDAESLRAIARRARVPAAARRAAALLAKASPATPAEPAPLAVPGPDADADERAAYERERTRLEQEAQAQDEAVRARVALCDALDAAAGAGLEQALDDARAAWAALPALAGPEALALARRFDEAVQAAQGRRLAQQAAEARRGAAEGLCARAEALPASSDPEVDRAALEPLRAEWNALVADGPVPAELQARFEAVATRAEVRRGEARQARAQEAADRSKHLEDLAARLEALAESPAVTLRDADKAVREAREAAAKAGALPGRREREALGRIEAARRALFPRLQELRQDAEWKHFANVDVQEELCRRAEALREAGDLEKAAVELRDLDARWKQAREAPKDQAEALWTRFKAARDEVRARCDAYFAKKADELAQNLARKQALCAQAEALQDATDWLKTSEALKALQAEWKNVGPVAHSKSKAVWTRFRKACDHFFARRDADRAQRREASAASLEKKQALCARAEALAESSEWEAAAAEVRTLQAEWKTAGAVRPSEAEAVWQRFHAACERFFTRYKRRGELADEAAAAAREALCADLEGLDPAADGLAEKVLAAQAAWRQAAPAGRERGEAVAARFAAAVARLVDAQPQAFAGTELDPEASLKKMEKLCARVEAAHAAAAPQAPGATTPQDLAARLRDALAANTIGGHAAVLARWREANTEVEAAQAAWLRLGPAPGARGDELRARFARVTAAFFAERPALPEPRDDARPERRPRGPGRPRPPRAREAQPRR